MTEVPLFVPIADHQAVLDQLAADQSTTAAVRIDALRYLRDCVEKFLALLDRSGDVTYDEMARALADVRRSVADARSCNAGGAA